MPPVPVLRWPPKKTISAITSTRHACVLKLARASPLPFKRQMEAPGALKPKKCSLNLPIVNPK